MKRRKALILSSGVLPEKDLFPLSEYEPPVVARTAAEGKRQLSAGHFDTIAVFAPLCDEFGIQTANEISGVHNQYVLLTVPFDSLDQAAYQCRELPVFVLSSNAQFSTIRQSIRFLEKAGERMEKLESALAREKRRFQDEKQITLCKIKLIEMFGWTEEEAHRYIGKTAMDHSVTRIAAARSLMRKMEYLEKKKAMEQKENI